MAGSSSKVAEVVIAGAGIAGVATAFALAERGVRNVVIADPRPPLSLTSRRPEANHRAWWPQPAMIELATRSIERIEALRADGARIPIDWRGYLYVSDDEATAGRLASLVAAHPARLASQAEAIDASELHHRWPHLGPQALGGILVGRAGGLDTVALGESMLARAQARGARLVQGRVVRVATLGRRVSGVRLETPSEPLDVACDIVVDAGGPFARALAQLAGADLPIETVLRQKVVIRDVAHVIPRDAPFTITLDGRTVPWTEPERARIARIPDGRRLLGRLPAGIHVKPDDTSGPGAIKLGWAWDQRPSAPVEAPQLPPEFPRQVLLGAASVIPALAPYATAVASDPSAIVAHDGGFYARAPDGLPLIGPVGGDAPSGFHTVSGLAGFGAMMAAAAGELAAGWILGRTAGMPTDGAGRLDGRAFDPRRFDDPVHREANRSGGGTTGEL